MKIRKSLMYKASHTLMPLSLILLFLLMGCHHAPGHPQANGDTGPACDNDTPAGAAWVEEQERAGTVWVAWFRSPMSTPQNPVILMDVVVESPLFVPQSSQANPGHLTGGWGLMQQTYLTEFGGGGVSNAMKYSCGCDSIIGASVISGNSQTDFTFDGTSTTAQKHGYEFKLCNMATWIFVNCKQDSEDHSNRPVNLPISVLTYCQRPDGSEYEVETTLVYKTFSNCSHAQL
jgi:hypothetical protein